MKRVIKIAGIVLLILIVGMFFFNSHVVKNSINHIVPKVLGVPVSVGNVKTFLILGRINVKDLVIGNPEGFKTDHLFSLGELNIRFKPLSLFTDTIIVSEVSVIAPDVIYEATLKGSNVGALQKQLGGEEEKPEEEAKADDSSGKKVVIEKFVLNEGMIHLSFPGMMGSALPIPLPPITMKDIGKEDDKKGASLTDVIGKIFSSVFSSITDVVANSGKLLGDGAKAIGEGAKAVGGAAADGAKAVGGAAADGAMAVGGAAADGAKAIGKGVANLFGGSDEKEDEEPTSEE